MDEVDNEEHEKIHLISKESLSDGSTDKQEDDVITRKKKINLKEAFLIMTAFSIGSGILVMPFTIRQLGFITWVVCISVMTISSTLCASLLWLSVQHMMEEDDDIDVTRDAYPSLGQFSYGRAGRIFTVVFLFAAPLTCAIVYVLLSSSILTDIVPIGAFTKANRIRIWSVVITSILTPVTYLGNYSDVRVPAMVAFVTSLLSTAAIIVNCMIYTFSTPRALTDEGDKHVNKNIFISLGMLFFPVCGVPITIPNITTLASRPQKLARCIAGSNICTYVTFLLIGVVPYLVFREHTLSSTSSTFYQVINSKHGGGIAFQVITTVLQVLMFVHITMAIVLAMNPCFLYVEDFLNIPHEFNPKRVIVRTTFMLFILLISVLIPQLDFVISLAGGVPFAIITTFLPVVIYAKLFEMPTYKKIFVFFFLVIIVVFILGNLAASIVDLI